MEKMKIIDLLNKIVNGELKEDTRFGLDHNYGYQEYLTVRKFFERYIVDKENLELDIIIEDTPKEDKKIEKIKVLNCDYYKEREKYGTLTNEEIVLDIETQKNKINEIINKINGEENESN